APGRADHRGPADRYDAGLLVAPNVSGVVRIVATLTDDHVVASRGRLLPGVVAAGSAHGRRVQERLRGHASPERARAAEEVALHERDARSSRSDVMRRGLARCAGADDDEIEGLGHDARSA